MGLKIESGVGNSAQVAVDDNNRLFTKSDIVPQLHFHTNDGEAFSFSTDFVRTVATANSGMIYIKNTSQTKVVELDFMRTCGTQVCEWTLWKNPTTGTLVTAGTAGSPVNANFESGVQFSGNYNIGADGLTITDGERFGTWINNVGHSIQRFEGGIHLGPNNSMAMTVSPAASATVCVTLIGWQTLDK